eukprot:3225405-Pyramimonas_sp.AAC.1
MGGGGSGGLYLRGLRRAVVGVGGALPRGERERDMHAVPHLVEDVAHVLQRQRVEHLQASKSKSQSQSQSQWTQQQPHLGGRERLRHPGSLSTVSQCHSGAASVQSKRHSVTVSQRTSSVRWLTSASIARGSATQPARCSL